MKVESHAFEWVWPNFDLRLLRLRLTRPNLGRGRNDVLVLLIERQTHLPEPEKYGENCQIEMKDIQ